ncbi:MAG: hypothetical protein NTW16_08470 [Bacteroidetes bacterium]|nr:hypothetical protein [Bacteroidota bacterium]
MKNFQHRTTNDAIDNRLKISNHQLKVPKAKLASGSVVGLYPIILDGGKTIIYTSDKSKESEIRSKYALRQ